MKNLLDILIAATLIAGMALITLGCETPGQPHDRKIDADTYQTDPAIIADMEQKKAADAAAHPPKVYHQCGAKTQKGTPCTRKVADGAASPHCFQHRDAKPTQAKATTTANAPGIAPVNQNQIVGNDALAPEQTVNHQCGAPTKKGTPCTRKVEGTTGFCFQHQNAEVKK